MRLLLDSCFSAAVAAQLRSLGHDASSVADPGVGCLSGAADEAVWDRAIVEDRAIVSANAADFGRLEALALARGRPTAPLILTSERDFPRGRRGTTDRLVTALDAMLAERRRSSV